MTKRLNLYTHQTQAVDFLAKRGFTGAIFADMGCVDCDTEYLSPNGWNKIKDYKGGMVAQFILRDNSANFVFPSEYIVRECKEMYMFSHSRNFEAVFSPEHRVLWWGLDKNPHITDPVYLYDKHQKLKLGCRARILGAFDLLHDCHIPFTDAQIRLQIACNADGHFPYTGRCDIRIKKYDKILRLKELLKELSVPYR